MGASPRTTLLCSGYRGQVLWGQLWLFLFSIISYHQLYLLKGHFSGQLYFLPLQSKPQKTTLSRTFNETLFLQSFQRRSSGNELLQSALHTVLITCIRSAVMQLEHWGVKTEAGFWFVFVFCFCTFLFVIITLYKNKREASYRMTTWMDTRTLLSS